MRRTKVNGDKLRNAILTALAGVKAGNLTLADVTTEVAAVMGRDVSDIEKAIIGQKNNTTSPEPKREFFAKVAAKVEFQTIVAGGQQGAPKADPAVWAADVAELDSLLD